jgi:hypothetical protein
MSFRQCLNFTLKDEKNNEIENDPRPQHQMTICRLIGDPDMKALTLPVTELIVVVDNCFIHIMVVDAFSPAGMLTSPYPSG